VPISSRKKNWYSKSTVFVDPKESLKYSKGWRASIIYTKQWNKIWLKLSKG